MGLKRLVAGLPASRAGKKASSSWWTGQHKGRWELLFGLIFTPSAQALCLLPRAFVPVSCPSVTSADPHACTSTVKPWHHPVSLLLHKASATPSLVTPWAASQPNVRCTRPNRVIKRSSLLFLPLCSRSPPSHEHRVGHKVDGQCKMLEHIRKGTALLSHRLHMLVSGAGCPP